MDGEMDEKKWTDGERDEAFDRGMETMQRVALELYRRGREPLLAELETVKRERDEARREADRFRHGCTVEGDFVCPNEYAVGELTAERNFLRALKKNHEEDFTRVCRERDEARAELSKLRKDYDSVIEANVSLLDGAPYVNARSAYRRGAEAMREACARWIGHKAGDDRVAWQVARLPIPEEP